jgi:ABC-type Fe3+ transport system substrate-binding protein
MKKHLLVLASLAFTALMATSCNGGSTASSDSGNSNSTEAIVKKASKMTTTELEAAAKAEMEASSSKFTVMSTTSSIATGAKAFQAKYTWLTDKLNSDKTGIKDAIAWTSLDQADTNFVYDVCFVQDAHTLGDYIDDGILHNYVPSDAATLGLPTASQNPLTGVSLTKVFFYNNTGNVNLTNIWQLAGTTADAKHISDLSFQNPTQEQINMSFFLSLYKEENSAVLKTTYKDYYGKDWAATDEYATIADEFVTEFINNVSVWHSSDGTAMKETVAQEASKNTVFFGSFTKMKDALAKKLPTDETKTVGSIVDWNFTMAGFKGFMYNVYAQIVNNAAHPYTACLFAHYILTPEGYKAACYSDKTPNKAGEAANMYGYNYPCDNATVGVNDNNWTKAQWSAVTLHEDYSYLKSVKASLITKINTIVSQSSSK